MSADRTWGFDPRFPFPFLPCVKTGVELLRCTEVLFHFFQCCIFFRGVTCTSEEKEKASGMSLV